MNVLNWQLIKPMSAIVFDCDGTLSTIEGVNELAQMNGVWDQVSALTEKAMGTSGMSVDIYKERLQLIHPTAQDVNQLIEIYYENMVPDAFMVIEALRRLKKNIYIVSAGIAGAIKPFGKILKVPEENIFAVDLKFDKNGYYAGFDHQTPLVHPHGKINILSDIKRKHPLITHIGDGLTDYVTHTIVTRFIGYGGAFYRENLANLCHYYIKSLSIASTLPLVITQKEYRLLNIEEKKIYDKGLDLIKNGEVIIQ